MGQKYLSHNVLGKLNSDVRGKNGGHKLLLTDLQTSEQQLPLLGEAQVPECTFIRMILLNGVAFYINVLRMLLLTLGIFQHGRTWIKLLLSFINMVLNSSHL